MVPNVLGSHDMVGNKYVLCYSLILASKLHLNNAYPREQKFPSHSKGPSVFEVKWELVFIWMVVCRMDKTWYEERERVGE